MRTSVRTTTRTSASRWRRRSSPRRRPRSTTNTARSPRPPPRHPPRHLRQGRPKESSVAEDRTDTVGDAEPADEVEEPRGAVNQTESADRSAHVKEAEGAV